MLVIEDIGVADIGAAAIDFYADPVKSADLM